MGFAHARPGSADFRVMPKKEICHVLLLHQETQYPQSSQFL